MSIEESPFTIIQSERAESLEKGQRKMVELKKRFSGFSEQVKDMNWKQLVSRIVETSQSSEIAQTKRLIMERLNMERLKSELPREALLLSKKLHAFRGHMFEYLVALEMVKDDEDVAIALYILDCLKHPSLLNLDLPSQKNPDHVGVVVDSETGEVSITGMYEVKLQKLTHSGERQIKQFYYNLRLIVGNINALIEAGKAPVVDGKPVGKINLKRIENLYKNVVVSYPDDEEEMQIIEGRNKQVEERGWKIKPSIFSVDDVDLLSAYFVKNAKIVKPKRKK